MPVSKSSIIIPSVIGNGKTNSYSVLREPITSAASAECPTGASDSAEISMVNVMSVSISQ